MLLKNSARDSRKGDKLKPCWKGPYKVHADLGKGVYTLYNEKTGKVLKKAVNISQLTKFHHNCPKSPEKIEQSPVVDDCASYPEKIEQSPVSLSTDLSQENNVDCWPVVDCASSPEKNEQSPVSLSTDIDVPSHMPLQDDADCSTNSYR